MPSITYSELQAEVGDYLCKSRTPADWNATDAARIASYIKRGVEQFYYPPPIGGKSHDWTFMRPVTNLQTVADQSVYECPADFGSLMGDMTWPSDEAGYFSIPQVGEGQIRAINQGRNLAAGKPMYVAIRPRKQDGAAAQVSEFVFERAFDAVYELTYRYRVIPQAISDTAPYVYGNPSHRETVLESCMAVAESVLNDGGNGLHKAAFLERLATSISLDRRSEPATLGYFGDGGQTPIFHDRLQKITYNGMWSEL